MPTVTEKLHPFAAAKAAGREPYKVKDLSLAEYGRKEIRLAEQEMPGLMALRTQHAGTKPLAGARVMGSLHMTIQTAVLCAKRHEARHFLFGQTDFLPPEFGEREILHLERFAPGRFRRGEGVMRFNDCCHRPSLLV